MININVLVSEKVFEEYGFGSKKISFDDLVKKIKTKIAKKTLKDCQDSAKKSGLSKMTMAQINKEVKAIRNAKVSH